MRKILVALIFAAAALAQPQPARTLIFVTVDPSGACLAVQPLQFNSVTGDLFGCSGGSWHKLGGGSSGGATIASTLDLISGDGSGNGLDSLITRCVGAGAICSSSSVLAIADPLGVRMDVLIGAGTGNTGLDVVLIGSGDDTGVSGLNNSGSEVIALGDGAAGYNSGSNVFAAGDRAAYQNSGWGVFAGGADAAYQNSGYFLNAIGVSVMSGSRAGDFVSAMGDEYLNPMLNGTLHNLTRSVMMGTSSLTQANSNALPTVGALAFTGTGLNDASLPAQSTFTGVADSFFTIIIDSVGSIDTFSWQEGAGPVTPSVPITTTPQYLIDGFWIQFAAITGHTLADQWVSTVTASTNPLDNDICIQGICTGPNQTHIGNPATTSTVLGGAGAFLLGGSAGTVVCWKSDGITLGYATVAEITSGTCH